MKLTPLAKGLMALIIIAGLGSVGWNLYKQKIQGGDLVQAPTKVTAPAAEAMPPVAAPAQPASAPVTQTASAPAPAAAAPIAPAPAAAPPTVEKPAAAATTTFNSFQRIVEKGVIRVSVQSPSKPFFFKENGVAKGFNLDFLKLLVAQPAFTQKQRTVVVDTEHPVDTYAAVPEQLNKMDARGNPVVDIAIDGLTFADDDQPGVVYTVPYISDFGYALITVQNGAIRTIADVGGKKVGILQGDPDVKAYARQQFPNAQLVELSDASVGGERTWINNAIKSGQVDAVIYDYPFAVAEIANTNLVFAVAKLPQSDIRYKIGLRKGDSQLLGELNAAIGKVKESPEYLALLKKYFVSSSVVQAAAASGSETVYVVKPGDTLSIIAAKLLGNKARYAEIEVRNNLPNPDLIQVGQKLVLPKN